MTKRTLLLASRIGLVIQRLSFVFSKPPKDLKIICLSTAANVYEEKPWLEDEKQPFRDMGFNLIELDIANKKPQQVSEKLHDADVIYVTGGNTYYLLQQMKACQFGNVLRECLERGVLYIGSSAGAIVLCDNIDFIRDMDDPALAKLDNYEGLGILDFKILPHLNHPKYGAKACKIAFDLQSSERILGLRDDQAVYIRDGFMEVY